MPIVARKTQIGLLAPGSHGMVSAVLFRLALVALAAALVVVFSVRYGDHRACDDARRGVFGATTGATERSAVAGHVRTVERRCRGSDALVATAGALRTLGDDAGALRAVREATRREPSSFSAWRALAAVAEGDEAERAARRAGELNPRWAQARLRASGSAPAGADDEGP